MKKTVIILFALFFVGFGASGAIGADVDLAEWTFNIDGSVTDWMFPDLPTPLPSGVGGTLTDGLGTLTWSTSAVGSHTFVAFFDHEIDQETNTFFNEYGTVNGVPAAGVTYQLGDPYGSIFTNVSNGTLDDTNTVGSGENDVSMALGWTFELAAGETGTISLNLSDILGTSPPSFYLSQTDPDSNASIYFSGDLDIHEGGPNPIPEPGTFMLLAGGLVVLLGWGRRKARS